MSIITDTSLYSCWNDRMINDTNFNTCGDHGKCVPNSKNSEEYLCKCDPSFEPTTNCTLNIYQMDDYYTHFGVYLGLSFIFFSIFMVLFVIELLFALTKQGIGKIKNTNNIVKVIYIFYYLFRIISLSMLAWNFSNKTTKLVAVETTFSYMASALIIADYLVSAINWLGLLLRARNLGTEKRKFKVMRICNIIAVSVGIPLIMICLPLSSLHIADPFTGVIALFAIIFIIIPASIVLLIFSSISFFWLKKMSEADRQKKSIIMVRYKTIFIFFASLVLLLYFVFLGASSILPSQLVGTILLKLDILLFVEILLSLFLWIFTHSTSWQKDKACFTIIKDFRLKKNNDSSSKETSEKNLTTNTNLPTDQNVTTDWNITSGRMATTETKISEVNVNTDKS